MKRYTTTSPLSSEEIRQIFELPMDRNSTMMKLHILTGLRANELLKLRFSDFYEKVQGQFVMKSRIKVFASKQRKFRIIPVSKRMGELIERYRKFERVKLSSNRILFLTKSGQPFNTTMYRDNVVKKMFADLGMAAQGTHTLRKSFGQTFYHANGETMEALLQLKEIFGHSSIEITKRYVGITSEVSDKMLDVMDGYLPDMNTLTNNVD